MSQSTSSYTQSSVCTLDCPDACSLSVHVKNNKIHQIRASNSNPYTDNSICSKVAKYYPDYIHGKNRLTHPLRRIGKKGDGRYQRISWKEALTHIHQQFTDCIEQYGSNSIVPLTYAGPHSELASHSMNDRFFNQLGARKINSSPLCAAVYGGAYNSLFGAVPGMPPEQASASDLIIIWGKNTAISNLHFSRIINKALKKGCRLIVIDPKKISIAKQADCYLSINPGTDAVLALAAAAELERRKQLDPDFIQQWTIGFDAYIAEARRYTRNDVIHYCGITGEQFDQFIQLYQNADKIALNHGVGLERNYHGGDSIRAILSLHVLTGHLGRYGDGIVTKASAAYPRNSIRLQASHLSKQHQKSFNILDISAAILDKSNPLPIKAVMIYNHNPIAVHPDQNQMRQALQQEDLFVVGCDVIMTDSMKMADIILPAASSFEINDIYCAYGHTWIQRAKPVIPPVGESLPNTEIFRRLAAQFGFNEPLFQSNDDTLMDEAFIDNDPRLKGYKPSNLPLDQAIEMHSINHQALVMCHSVFPDTPSGKIELYSQTLENRYQKGVPHYNPLIQNQTKAFPLRVITPSSNKRCNSTFGQHPDSLSPEIIEIHPHDAHCYQIKNNMKVKVSNQLGEVTLVAKITDHVKQGVLYTAKGTWLSSSSTNQTINALIPNHRRTSIYEGACYNDTFVSIAPL